MTAPLDALFLSPHPDDVEIFCGGTVAKLSALGRRVAVVDLTRGELSSNGTPEQRRVESEAASLALGLDEPRRCLDLGDGQLDDRDPAQLRAVVTLLRELRPRMIFAPVERDRHPDHQATARLIHRAHFFGGLPRYDAPGDPARADQLIHYVCHMPHSPSFLVDVSAHMEARRAAIASYASQFERRDTDAATPINDPGFLPSMESRMAEFGRQVGVAFAEPFVMPVPPLLRDPLTDLTRGTA